MKKLYVLLAAAAVVSLLIVLAWKPSSLGDHLIKDKAAKALPEFAGTIRKEPADVDAVLLHYSHAKNKVPLYVAEASLLKYPEMAEKILPVYGNQPEFRSILSSYGSSVLPPIYYFMNNNVHSVEAMYYSAQKMNEAGQKVHEAKTKLKSFFGFGQPKKKHAKTAATSTLSDGQAPTAVNSGEGQGTLATSVHPLPDANDGPSGQNGASLPPLTPTLKGWFAINFIHNSGHDFLSQFTIAKDGQVTWIQSERVLQDLNSFFAGGIRKLDTKYQTGQKVTASDVGWAAADVIGTIGGLKILKVGKAAETAAKTTEAVEDVSRTAKAVEDAGRTAKVAEDAGRTAREAEGTSRTAKEVGDVSRTADEAKDSGRVASVADGAAQAGRTTAKGVRYVKYAKWPLVVATGWLVLNHPSVITDVLAGLAHILGLPAWLVELVGWFIILLPLLYVCSWVLKYLIRPTVFVLRMAVRGLMKIEHLSRSHADGQKNASNAAIA